MTVHLTDDERATLTAWFADLPLADAVSTTFARGLEGIQQMLTEQREHDGDHDAQA